MGYVLGIDIGTANTVAAIAERGGKVRLLRLSKGQPGIEARLPAAGLQEEGVRKWIPTRVWRAPNGKLVVGDRIPEEALARGHGVAREFASLLGTPGPIVLDGVEYPVEGLFHELIKTAIAAARAEEGVPPDVLVITYRAGYASRKTGAVERVRIVTRLFWTYSRQTQKRLEKVRKWLRDGIGPSAALGVKGPADRIGLPKKAAIRLVGTAISAVKFVNGKLIRLVKDVIGIWHLLWWVLGRPPGGLEPAGRPSFERYWRRISRTARFGSLLYRTSIVQLRWIPFVGLIGGLVTPVGKKLPQIRKYGSVVRERAGSIPVPFVRKLLNFRWFPATGVIRNVGMLSDAEALVHDWDGWKELKTGDSVLVYDFGAGALKISPLRRAAWGFERTGEPVIRHDISGNALDRRLLVMAAGRVARDVPDQVVADPENLEAARGARELLSTKQRAVVRFRMGDRIEDVSVERSEFESGWRELLEQSVEEIRSLRIGAGANVTLVIGGGCSRMPMLVQRLRDLRPGEVPDPPSGGPEPGPLPMREEGIRISRVVFVQETGAAARGAARWGLAMQEMEIEEDDALERGEPPPEQPAGNVGGVTGHIGGGTVAYGAAATGVVVWGAVVAVGVIIEALIGARISFENLPELERTIAGQTLTLSFQVISRRAPDTGTIDIDWGDGSISEAISFTAGKLITVQHEYARAGDFRATLFASAGEVVAEGGVKTLVTATGPGTPRDLQAIPGDGVVDLAWAPPVNDGGSEITGYAIRVDPDPIGEVHETTGPTRTITGLENGVRYQFSVVARNQAGTSPEPAETSAIPQARTSVPVQWPSSRTVNADSSQGAKHVYEFPDTAVLSVGETVTVACRPEPGSVFPLGSNTVTCVDAADPAGKALHEFEVMVVDQTSPWFAGIEGRVVEAEGVWGARADYTLPAAVDLVDSSVDVACSPPPGTVVPLGTTTVTCSAIDDANNKTTGSFVVNVTDTVPPSFGQLAPVTREATGPTGATVPYPAPKVADAVDRAPVVTCNPASGTRFPLGTTEVRCTASDFARNAANGTFTVTVVDTTPPSLTGLAEVVLEARSPEGVGADYPLPAAVDLVDSSVDVACTPPPGTIVPLGPTNVTCSATDRSGNRTTEPFSINVVDTTPPALDAAVLVSAVASSSAGGLVYFPLPVAVDVVDPNPVVMCIRKPGELFTIGDHFISCTATDLSGNSRTDPRAVRVTVTPPRPTAITGDRDRQSMRVNLGLNISAASVSASDFVVLLDDGSRPTVTKVDVSGQDMFLTLNQRIPSGDTPVVGIVGAIVDERGRLIDAQSIEARDGLPPILKVSLSAGSGMGTGPDGPSRLTKDTMTITISSDEPLAGAPLVRVFNPAGAEQSPPTAEASLLSLPLGGGVWRATFRAGSVQGIKSVVVSGVDASPAANVGTTGTPDPGEAGAITFRVDSQPPAAIIAVDGITGEFPQTVRSRPIIIADYSAGEDRPVAIVRATVDKLDVTKELETADSRRYFHVSRVDLSYGKHEFTIGARDIAGNVGTAQVAFAVIEPPPFEVTLLRGWNAVSMPSDPIDTDINAVFRDPRIDEVVAYDPLDRVTPWRVSVRDPASGNFTGALQTIRSGPGYWVRSTEKTTIEVAIASRRASGQVDLSSGWNFIGAVLDPAAAPPNPSSYLSKLDGLWVAVVGYEAADQRWRTDIAPEQNASDLAVVRPDGLRTSVTSIKDGLVAIEAGKAYWLYMLKEFSFTP